MDDRNKTILIILGIIAVLVAIWYFFMRKPAEDDDADPGVCDMALPENKVAIIPDWFGSPAVQWYDHVYKSIYGAYLPFPRTTWDDYYTAGRINKCQYNEGLLIIPFSDDGEDPTPDPTPDPDPGETPDGCDMALPENYVYYGDLNGTIQTLYYNQVFKYVVASDGATPRNAWEYYYSIGWINQCQYTWGLLNIPLG